ncbi:uncharacterized protein LOC132795065 [Drosophila nasuta]|uniref:uncharacterized protein LOC132795065 n=1 Tax=Drosophila nasuta TaxID=42062 RepID=UPI00295E91A3|nr:uncharacterized protein LOC132795065 [Drosophila nasuta]
MRKQATWLTALLMLACSCSTLLQLVQANDDSDEVMTMKMSEVVDLLMPFGQSCDPVPERVHLEEMVLNKDDASHPSKCFRRCMLMQFELMPEGEKLYDGAKTNEMMNMMFPDKEEQSRLITAKCNQASGLTDECEIAHSIAMCMLREMRVAAYKIPEIKD